MHIQLIKEEITDRICNYTFNRKIFLSITPVYKRLYYAKQGNLISKGSTMSQAINLLLEELYAPKTLTTCTINPEE
jgi:hypothetical protein